MNALLIDEESGSSVRSDNEADGVIPDESPEEIEASRERLGRILARNYFEQFPGQRSILAEVARSILLFGSASEIPSGYAPKLMTPGWFERLTGASRSMTTSSRSSCSRSSRKSRVAASRSMTWTPLRFWSLRTCFR